MNNILLAAAAVIAAPAAIVGYIVLTEKLLELLPDRKRTVWRPWLWIGPSVAMLLVFLVYPALQTLVLSFYDATSTEFVGLANYEYVFTAEESRTALRNNAIWLIVFAPLTVTLGLVIAVLLDRVPYESAAKSAIFLPMAISFVAAGVIWKFMYSYRPPGLPQTGTLNAALMAANPHFEPQAWLVNEPWNNVFLIVVGVWIWTGFCMVILSAALKGIPQELLEAARVDGASEFQVFRHIIVPMIGSTIAVVATTMVIFALKAFDIVYVMTSGNFDTDVIANQMYQEMFNFRDYGRASAIAVALLLAIVPIMVANIGRFRRQEEIR